MSELKNDTNVVSVATALTALDYLASANYEERARYAAKWIRGRANGTVNICIDEYGNQCDEAENDYDDEDD